MFETWSSSCLLFAIVLFLSIFIATGAAFATEHHDLHYYGCTDITNSQYLQIKKELLVLSKVNAVASANGCGFKLTYDFTTSQPFPFLESKFVGWFSEGVPTALGITVLVSLSFLLVWATGYHRHAYR